MPKLLLPLQELTALIYIYILHKGLCLYVANSAMTERISMRCFWLVSCRLVSLHSSLIPYPSTRVYPLQLVLWRTPLQPPRVDGEALRTVFRWRHISGYVKATFDWIILNNLGNGSSCSVTLYLYKVAPVVDCPCFKLLLSINFLLVRCEGLLDVLAMCYSTNTATEMIVLSHSIPTVLDR